MRTSFKFYLLFAAFFFGMEGVSLFAGNWNIIDLGTLGGSETFANSINDSGAVVGMSRLAGDGESHAFFYSGGVMSDNSPIKSDVLRWDPLGLNNLVNIASGDVLGDNYYRAY